MEDSLKKSGILEWSEENITKSPEGSGVYVLTNSPTNGSSIGLEFVQNLRTSLSEINRVRTDELKPKFFYWYIASDDESRELVEKLRAHYSME